MFGINGLWIGYGLWIEYGLWIMDWIWIGFGFNISELNGYGLDLELESSPSGTSGSQHKYYTK